MPDLVSPGGTSDDSDSEPVTVNKKKKPVCNMLDSDLILVQMSSYGPFTQGVGFSVSVRGNANANARMGTTPIHFAAEALLLMPTPYSPINIQ